MPVQLRVSTHTVVHFVEIQCKQQIMQNPTEANSKCSGSAIHTCMKVEPPIQRIASQVYPISILCARNIVEIVIYIAII